MSDLVRYFIDALPSAALASRRHAPLIRRANAALARYDGLLARMSNAGVLLVALATQGTALSSMIEITHADALGLGTIEKLIDAVAKPEE